jgi:hypothetical protein
LRKVQGRRIAAPQKAEKIESEKSGESPASCYPDNLNITGIALDFVNGNQPGLPGKM